MMTKLTDLLPRLGFKEEIVIPLEEDVIFIPHQFRNTDNPTRVVYLSEFKAKYESFYLYLKTIFEK